MANTPEGRVKAAVRKMLKEAGVYHRTPATGGYGKSGMGDEFVLYRGVPICIECKPDADTMPTALQTKNAIEFHDHGGAVFLIHKDNIHELHRYLDCVCMHGKSSARPFVWPAKAIEAYNEMKKA